MINLDYLRRAAHDPDDYCDYVVWINDHANEISEAVDALRAALAAAEARAEQEHVNAERLADAADSVLMQMWGYDENTLNNDVYCVSTCELDALRESLKPYMDDDLGEEVEP